MLSPPITGQKDLDTYLFDLHQNVLETGASRVGLLNPSDSNPLVYLYRYIHIKYATDTIGNGFSDVPTNANYYGILNNDSTTQSSNPTDYTWYKATQNFGTTYYLYYQTIGGRQIKFNIATVTPGVGWVQENNVAIDLDKITSSESISAAFSAYFMPSSLQVPRNTTTGIADFSTIVMKLYGANNNIITTYSTAQTDSDVSFVNDSWRIGDSSTTGNAGIAYNNITVGSPTLVTDHAEWPIPSAMTASANVIVPIRYKNIYGVVTQSGVVIQQLVFSDSGTPGTQSDTAYLYQWTTVTPGNPNGTSLYTWASRSNSGYTGTNGWSTTLTANPGTAGIRLWVATKDLVASIADSTTTVSWTSGFTKRIASATDGLQQATVSIYKWDITIPAISGTATYTWASRTYSPTTATSGWSATIPSAPSVGYTLYQASVNLSDSINNTTSSINWTTASISPISYSGDAGTSGSSSRLTFARISGNPTPVSATVTTSGNSSFPPSGSWSITATWSGSDPNPSSTNSLYQADGIYNPSTNQTVWSTPYISSLKVGSLSAITVNTGALTVTGNLLAGNIVRNNTAVSSGNGALIEGNTGNFALGNSTTNITFNGSQMTLNGNVVATGNLNSNSVTVPANVSTYLGTAINKNGFGVWQQVGGVSTSYASAPSAVLVTVSLNLLYTSGAGTTASYVKVTEINSGITTLSNGITHTNSTILSLTLNMTGISSGARNFQVEVSQETGGPSFMIGNASLTTLATYR